MAQAKTTTPFKPTSAGSWAGPSEADEAASEAPKRVRKTKPKTEATADAKPKRVRKTKPAVTKTKPSTTETKTAKVKDAAKEKKAKALARQAAAQVKREEREAKAEAKDKVAKKVEKSLVSVAKEVNVRFEKAMQADGKADDHRLAAALRLADAKVTCTDAGINFKKWAEDNVTQGYETVRKMLAIGTSADPAQAMADLRAGNKAANQKARDSAKAAVTGESGTGDTKLSDLAVMKRGFASLSEDDQEEFVMWGAEQIGATLADN